jgi:hypothetical protein
VSFCTAFEQLNSGSGTNAVHNQQHRPSRTSQWTCEIRSVPFRTAFEQLNSGSGTKAVHNRVRACTLSLVALVANTSMTSDLQ